MKSKIRNIRHFTFGHSNSCGVNGYLRKSRYLKQFGHKFEALDIPDLKLLDCSSRPMKIFKHLLRLISNVGKHRSLAPGFCEIIDIRSADNHNEPRKFIQQAGIEVGVVSNERRKTWVEKVKSTASATWMLDLAQAPLNSLPHAPNGEKYNGMLIGCGPNPILGDQTTVMFHLAQDGIAGGWGGMALLAEDGSYLGFDFSEASAADEMLKNSEGEALRPNMTSAEKTKFESCVKKCDSFLQLIERGRLSPSFSMHDDR